jgi:hypothetical protein
MSDLTGVNDTLPVRIGGVSSASGLPDNYADVNSGGSLQVAGQGTAGTPAGGVVSIQGVTGGTAVPVSGTFWQSVQPVSQSSTPWLTSDAADGPVTPGTVATKSMLAGGQYNSTQPTLTNTQQSALQLDPLGNLRATLPDRQVSGTLGSLGATITLSNLNGMSSGALELDGSFSGTILVEGASGPTQYCTIGLYNISSGYATAINLTGATVQGNYQLIGIGSYTTIKATVSAYTSGSLTAYLTASSGIDLINVVSPFAANFNVQAVGNVPSGTADSGNGIKVSGIYNSATPTFLNGQRADLQVNSSGALIVTGTVIATNPSVSQVNTTTPSYATYIGGYASTSPPTWGNGDLAPLSIENVGGYLRTADSSDGPVTPGTAATTSLLTGGQYNSTLPTLTSAQQSAIQLDSSGRQIIAPLTSASIVTVDQGTSPWTVQGDSASGAAKAGNPVQIGGVFNTTQPTVTTGETVEAQSTARGALIVATGVDSFNIDNITGTVSLPTGASTSANQATEIASLQLIDNPIGSVAPGTAGTGSSLVGGVFSSTPPTVTNGQQVALQVDSAGKLLVDAGTITIAPLTTTTLINVNSIPVDGTKATYSATSAIGFASATNATDIFTITGSASKIVRIVRIAFSAQETTAGVANVLLIKRSAANTGGTSAAATAVPHDSTNSAATATVLNYTANPSALGAAVGTIRSARIFIPTSGSDVADTVDEWDFGFGPEQCIVLRGTTQVLAINLNATTVTGGTWNCYVEWTEE